MLSEAAEALQKQVGLIFYCSFLERFTRFQEEKYKDRLENSQSRLDHEKVRRLSVERELEMAKMELKELRESQREE